MPKITPKFIDIPELAETFSDHLGMTTFDGVVMRTEFQVIRVDEPAPPAPPSGRSYPVCRLVLTTQTMLEFYNRLHNLVDQLEKSGAVKRSAAGLTQTRQ